MLLKGKEERQGNEEKEAEETERKEVNCKSRNEMNETMSSSYVLSFLHTCTCEEKSKREALIERWEEKRMAKRWGGRREEEGERMEDGPLTSGEACVKGLYWQDRQSTS